jgi:ABC-2 type transport system ATP-binding protein
LVTSHWIAQAIFSRMSAIVLSIRGLRKSFARGLARCTHRTVAISGVDLDLFQSEIVGVIGAEGSGKTTLLQCACGLLRPDSGSVVARHPVGYVPAIPVYYPFLTVRDVIALRTSRFPTHSAEMTHETLDLLGLYHARNEIIATLSPSELMRVSIAEAIIGKPAALMIDTSCSAAGIDRISTKRALNFVSSLGIAILIAARERGVVESCVGRVIQLSEGRILTAQSAPMFVAERLH